MFIYTLKATNIKFFAALLLSAAVLITVVSVIPDYESGGQVAAASVNYSGIKTEDDRVAFLKELGYEVEATPVETAEVEIPVEFDSVYTRYNDIQRSQGLNLKKYRGKTATRYTYRVTNYNNYEGTVLASLIVYKNKIIAGDICGIDGNSFVHGFKKDGN
jgi:hypothetical protein